MVDQLTLIDFENQIQKQITLDLYNLPQWPEDIREETLRQIQNDYPSELISKTLKEYRLYFDKISENFRLITKYEHHPQMGTKCTLIHYLVLTKQLKTMKFLLENFHVSGLEMKMNIYINDRLIHGVTPLWLAANDYYTDMMVLLLKHGANPNTTNTGGASPLRLSAFDENLENIRILLEHGADPNLVNNFNNTALMLASYKGNVETVKLLLRYGADPNKAAYCGNTALHFASEAGNLQICRELLDRGAKFQANISGLTPIFMAALNRFENLVDLFFSIPNLVTLRDRITTYELLGAGICLQKFHREMPPSLMANVYDYFRQAFLLRYVSKDLNSVDPVNLDKIECNPVAIPIHQKPMLENRSEYNGIKETETLDELNQISLDGKRLLYECLFAMVRFYGEKNLKTAEALTMVGARLIDQYREFMVGFAMWKRSIEIKINLKVFISRDLQRFTQALCQQQQINMGDGQQSNFQQFWMEILAFAIQYFEARPLPYGLQALAFQLNVHDLSQIEHFTLNDVKVENIISPINHCYDLTEEEDVDNVIETVLLVILFFTQRYDSLSQDFRSKMLNTIGKFLKLNYTYSRCGRHLIHMIFVDPKFSNHQAISSVLSMLYRCGVNTNVYDTAYNTPLHYMAFYTRKNNESVRTMSSLYEDLIAHVYYGKYIPNALYHFDYGDLNRVHLDAVNVFNQTAFDINPALQFCCVYPHMNLFPLKCLAARVAHSRFLRCGPCRYLSMYRYSDRMQYNLVIRQTMINDANGQMMKPRRNTSGERVVLMDDQFYEQMINLKDHHYNQLNRMEKTFSNYPLIWRYNQYADHVPKKYDARNVWKLIDQYSKDFKISVKLVEFIEMHGPCKFVHHLHPTMTDHHHHNLNVDPEKSI